MKGFFCLDKKKHFRQKKRFRTPGKSTKEIPNKKTSGAGPGFSEKVTKESQTKFQNSQVFKNPKIHVIFLFLPG